MGRARWENVAIVVDGHWRLHQDKPVVLYAGDDRPGGRIYKWVSKSPYTAGMTRGQIRALLDEGRLFVAHFAGLDNRTGLTLVTGQTPTPSAPGAGQWIHLSVTSTDIAPNAEALGVPKTTVGAALKDVSWNKIAGFSTDHDVRRALFTASAKIGVMELNRPEDLEWNPKDPSGTPRLYVAFTKHTYGTQLDQAGKLLDSTVTEKRNDHDGAIFVIQEADPDNPGVSTSFTYFQAWKGSAPGGNVFAAANPDNLMIDREGGVWFGTDGTFARTNGHSADALYYLDLTPAHHSGRPGVLNPSFGTAFRVVAVPSDAEATGPAFSADMKTIFLSVQHPGEHHPSTWPQDR
jgi:secreted PhoX family phosphatase